MDETADSVENTKMERRLIFAHALMILAIIFSFIGFAMINFAWGFIAAAVSIGFYAYKLGESE